MQLVGTAMFREEDLLKGIGSPQKPSRRQFYRNRTLNSNSGSEHDSDSDTRPPRFNGTAAAPRQSSRGVVAAASSLEDFMDTAIVQEEEHVATDSQPPIISDDLAPTPYRHRRLKNLILCVINESQGQTFPEFRSILKSMNALWLPPSNDTVCVKPGQLKTTSVLREMDSILKFVTRPLAIALSFALIHLEMLYAPVHPKLHMSLRSSYWFLDRLTTDVQNSLRSINSGPDTANVSMSFHKRAATFLASSSSLPRMTIEGTALLYDQQCLVFTGLYGEALAQRVSILANDESMFSSNWSLTSTPTEMRSLVEYSRRQLRCVDPFIKSIDALAATVTVAHHINTSKAAAGQPSTDYLRRYLLLYKTIHQELTNLLGAIVFLIAAAVAELCFTPICDITQADEALWSTWVSLGRPLRLFEQRIVAINDHFSKLSELIPSNNSTTVWFEPFYLPSESIMSTLTVLREATSPITEQMQLVHSQFTSSRELIAAFTSGIPPLCSASHSLERALEKTRRVSTSEDLSSSILSRSMVAAFDSDFSAFLNHRDQVDQPTSWLQNTMPSNQTIPQQLLSQENVEIQHEPLLSPPVRQLATPSTPVQSSTLEQTPDAPPEHVQHPSPPLARRRTTTPVSPRTDQSRTTDLEMAPPLFCEVPLWNQPPVDTGGQWHPISGNSHQQFLPTVPPKATTSDIREKSRGAAHGAGRVDTAVPQKESSRSSASPVPTVQKYDWEIDYTEIGLEENIGCGATSKVYRGLWRGTEVAVKKMTSSLVDAEEMNKFRREIQILLKLRHPNLVLLMGASIRSRPYFVVMEYCEGGDLFSLLHLPNKIKHHTTKLTLRQKLKIALDIAKGMTYLHKSSPQILHRDLKSLNILLTNILRSPADEPHAKITDFGLSQLRCTQSNELLYQTAAIGTYHWMAPEILMSQPYNESVDVYSFGILLYEIFSQCIPYAPLTDVTVLPTPVNIGLAVCQGLRPDLTNMPQDTPQAIVSLMTSCWSHDRLQRPNFEELLKILKNISFNLYNC